MKRLIVLLMILFTATLAHGAIISTDAFISPDDVTIGRMEDNRVILTDALNNFDGQNINANSISDEALDPDTSSHNFRGEAFNDWVYEGFLSTSGAGLTHTVPGGTAYVGGWRISKDDTSYTFTGSKDTYVDLDLRGRLIYTELANGGSPEPAIAGGTTRLMKVVTDATDVTSVRDDRFLSISLDDHQADFYRAGLDIASVVTQDDQFTINPGVCYWGNKRIQKNTSTVISTDEAGDWFENSVPANDFFYVAMDKSGQIKFTDQEPTKHDTIGNTAGKKYYCENSGTGTLYRCLAWGYTYGSSKMREWCYGNFKDGNVSNATMVSQDSTETLTGAQSTLPARWGHQMPGMILPFYSSGNTLFITGNASVEDTANRALSLYITIDSTPYVSSCFETAEANLEQNLSVHGIARPDIYSQGEHQVKLYWGAQTGGTVTTTPGADRTLTVTEL